MSARRFGSVALLVVAAGSLAGCADEDPGGSGPMLVNTTVAPLGCTPATTRECPCLHGGVGSQTCMPSGDAYGPCESCPPPPPAQTPGTAGAGAMDDGADGGGLAMPDAGALDAATMGDAGGEPDAGDAGGPELDPIGLGTSCGVGLPVLCDLESEKCCARSLRTDTCIGLSESCECDLPDCTVMEARCDGPEDCPDGQVCCGTLSGGARYERFECANSCDYAGTQRIACHQAEPECPAGNECANSQLLTNVQVCIDPATIQQ